MKLTKWFRNGEKPVHVGVYQRKYPWGINYAYFDGESWAFSSDSIAEAKQWAKYSKMRVFADDLLWRGVVKQ